MNNDLFLIFLSVIIFFLDHEMFNVFVACRLIRIIAIYLVQFPNPCVNSHITRYRSHDLIISGHTIQWNLIFMYFYDNYEWFVTFPFACLLLLYYIYIIKKEHHYSIDVFFGLYVSTTMYIIIKHLL